MSSFAYVRRAAASARLVWLSCALASFGCAGVKSGQSGGGGTGDRASSASAGNGASGGTGDKGSGGDIGIIPDGGLPPPADASSCQTKDVKFLPQVPSVYVLVDRSGSEFDLSSCSSTTMSYTSGTFFTLKTAVLQVINNLQGQVRFGFGAFVGDHATGTCAPTLSPTPDQLPIDLYNYDAINSVYSPLGSLSPCSAKADTPASDVIPTIKSTLLGQPATAVNPMTGATYNVGKNYVLFVTDSETDFCDDSEASCAADAVTWRIQDLYKSSIGTLIIGLPASASSGDTIATSVLQNFANAGAGQPVAPPTSYTPLQIYYDCKNGPSAAAWTAVWNEAGQSGMNPIATYAATGGAATVYSPSSATDVQALSNQIAAAVQGVVKSCTFDLSGFKIDLTKLSEAAVLIDGNPVGLDPSNGNGWDMVSPTELQLFGGACNGWLAGTSTDIKFDFPCDVIITTN